MRRLFRFDEPPAEYELLETESGEPSFFAVSNVIVTGWPWRNKLVG